MQPATNGTANCVFSSLVDLRDPPEVLRIKFAFIVVINIFMSILGLMLNSMVILVFSRSSFISTQSRYLIMLALSDMGVIITAVLLYSVEVIIDFTNNLDLHLVWANYLSAVYLASHVFQVTSVYITVAATVERLLSICFNRIRKFLPRGSNGPFLVSLLIFLLACVFSAPRYLEIELRQNCDTSKSFYQVGPSWLVLDPQYALVYSLWLCSLITCLIPFTMLLVMNTIITYRISNGHQKDLSPTGPDGRRVINGILLKHLSDRSRRQVRKEANSALVVVVFVFLICNLPSFILALIEHVDRGLLEDNPLLYTYCRDLINVLSVINASTNFFVYYNFGHKFRRQVKAVFFRTRHLTQLLVETMTARSRQPSYSV